MHKHIKIIKELYNNSKSTDLILEELDKCELTELEKIFIIREALEIKNSEAKEIVLTKYKGRLTDDLLDSFLKDDITDEII